MQRVAMEIRINSTAVSQLMLVITDGDLSTFNKSTVLPLSQSPQSAQVIMSLTLWGS